MVNLVLAIIIVAIGISIIVTVANNAKPIFTGCNDLLTGLSNALGETLC